MEIAKIGSLVVVTIVGAIMDAIISPTVLRESKMSAPNWSLQHFGALLFRRLPNSQPYLKMSKS
jgi:hypothetical protein